MHLTTVNTSDVTYCIKGYNSHPVFLYYVAYADNRVLSAAGVCTTLLRRVCVFITRHTYNQIYPVYV